jgi:hypothetical protein
MTSSITCGKCKKTHTAVGLVKACYQGNTGLCGWQYNVPTHYSPEAEDFIDAYTAECDALSWWDERGTYCEAGHEHVNAQARHDEGWDYAEDIDEATNLRKHGIQAVSMRGDSI